MITSKYFKEHEFQRCTPPCSLQDMSQKAVNMFDKARKIAGIPFIINCAYRTREQDIAKGRSGNSAHTKGYALDIRCTDTYSRYKIITALLEAGFNRIGDGKTFVHADCDPSLPQNRFWTYY